jgi:hypothetical protein
LCLCLYSKERFFFLLIFLSFILIFDIHLIILIFFEASFLLIDLFNESFLFEFFSFSFSLDILVNLLFKIFSDIFISFLSVFLVEGVSFDKLIILLEPNLSNIGHLLIFSISLFDSSNILISSSIFLFEKDNDLLGLISFNKENFLFLNLFLSVAILYG